jgi:hypothetical protein
MIRAEEDSPGTVRTPLPDKLPKKQPWVPPNQEPAKPQPSPQTQPGQRLAA